MQPAFAIPPYDRAQVLTLVGVRCAVPVLSNPAKRWWVEIKEVVFINANSVMVKVHARHRKFGKPRFCYLHECQWNKQQDEPLVLAIHKARAAATS